MFSLPKPNVNQEIGLCFAARVLVLLLLCFLFLRAAYSYSEHFSRQVRRLAFSTGRRDALVMEHLHQELHFLKRLRFDFVSPVSFKGNKFRWRRYVLIFSRVAWTN